MTTGNPTAGSTKYGFRRIVKLAAPLLVGRCAGDQFHGTGEEFIGAERTSHHAATNGAIAFVTPTTSDSGASTRRLISRPCNYSICCV